MTEHVDLNGTAYAHVWLTDPIAVLYEIAKRHSGVDVWMTFADASFLIVQSQETAKTVLRHRSEEFDKYFGVHRSFFGHSRLTANGEDWRLLRDHSQPYLSKIKPAEAAVKAVGYYKTAADRIIAEADATRKVVIDDAIDLAAASTVSVLVLGIDFAQLGPKTIRDIRNVFACTSVLNWRPLDEAAPEDAGLIRKARRSYAGLRHDLLALSETDADGSSLFSRLARSECDVLDFADEVSTLLVAGYETTASAIGWSLSMLARVPALQDRLRTALGGLTLSEDVNIDVLLDNEEILAVSREALRMFPPVPILGRIANRNTVVGGDSVPSGQRVLVSTIGLHQNKDVFAKPAAFRFDRFPNGRIPESFRESYKPFGDGQRICPGARFALAEIAVALAVIVERVRLEPSGEPVPPFYWGASMRRKMGQTLVVQALH
ncbi:MAG: cytochrome P450 [Pseudomonadota bacterium]